MSEKPHRRRCDLGVTRTSFCKKRPAAAHDRPPDTPAVTRNHHVVVPGYGGDMVPSSGPHSGAQLLHACHYREKWPCGCNSSVTRVECSGTPSSCETTCRSGLCLSTASHHPLGSSVYFGISSEMERRKNNPVPLPRRSEESPDGCVEKVSRIRIGISWRRGFDGERRCPPDLPRQLSFFGDSRHRRYRPFSPPLANRIKAVPRKLLLGWSGNGRSVA
jgi:hypothetical protein